MPGFHVNDLKSNINSFARGYLFNVFFTAAPVPVVGGENQTAYLARATNLPESTIDPIEVPWQGQVYPIGSTHTFTEWTITFNIDSNAQIIEDFHQWQRLVHDPATNVQGDPSVYMGEVVAELINTNGDPISQYVLFHCWPTTVGAVEVSHDNKDVAQFDVTFRYLYHVTQ